MDPQQLSITGQAEGCESQKWSLSPLPPRIPPSPPPPHVMNDIGLSVISKTSDLSEPIVLDDY